MAGRVIRKIIAFEWIICMIQTISDALAEKGYTTLTSVQEAVSDIKLLEKDLLVSAQTGSGKTVGFGLAMSSNLLGDSEQFESAKAPLALVIVPTRELALQVKRELAWLFAKAGATLASCVGGMDMRDERRALERGAHIVVATPGRLRDHIHRGSINISELKVVILDEADEMLDLGFREDLEFILGESPKERRTLMFSATVPKAIANLAKSYQNDGYRISIKGETEQHSDIDYRALSVSGRDTENAIINVLRYYEAPNALVFCNTRAMVNRLTTRFSNRGFSVVALSGELTQSERTNALQAMRDGRARVCVATDVAARGIDLPNLGLVIHADLPTNFEIMLHRSGRTGRAGRKGTSVLIVPGKSSQKAERLLKMAKIEATWEKPPSADAVREKDHERLLSDPNWSIPVKESEQKFLTKLKSVYTAEQISLAYIRLYESRQSSPEELDDTPNVTRDSSRSKFGPTIWFSLALGRDKGADPRSLLPMICNGGGITKDDIGAIRIQSNETFFELKKKCVERFVLSVGPSKKLEDRVQLRQLEKVPDFDQSPNSTRPHSKPRSSPRRAERKENYSKPNMNKRNNRGPSDNGASKRLNPIDRVPREGAVTPLKGERKSKPRDFSGKSERRESFAKPRQSNAHKSNNENLSNSERPKRFEKNTKMSSEGTKVFSPKDKKYSAKSQSNKADSSTLKEARSKAKPRLESSVKPKSTRPVKSRSNANDTSKRFSPKGKSGKLKNKKPNERN